MSEPTFFVGYSSSLAPDTRRFLVSVAAGLAAAALALAILLSISFDNPGDGRVQGEADIRGLLLATPYPAIVSPPDAEHPAGHTVMLAGYGKTGISAGARAQAGRTVEAKGYLLKRGDLDMLLVGDADVTAASDAPPTLQARPLGRWRIAGEICDGKCYAGAMRPGQGLAHKACALLCIDGGAPPVFVSGAPVDGASFFLMAGADGGPISLDLARIAAMPLVIEADVERIGDLAILKADWSHALPTK